VTVAWITRSRVARSPLSPPVRADREFAESAASFGVLTPSTLDALRRRRLTTLAFHSSRYLSTVDEGGVGEEMSETMLELLQ
jgi:hypothetical protein